MAVEDLFLAEAEEGVCTDHKPLEVIRHTPNDNCHNPATEPIINSVTKFIRNEEKTRKTTKNAKNTKTSKNIPTTAHYSIPEDKIPPGSRLQHFIESWKKMTTQTWSLSVIQDEYKIQFNSTLIPWTIKTYKMSESDQQAINKAVESFLKSEVIERSPTQDKRSLSQVFTIKEPNKVRSILDCRNINRFIQCQHFKMEGVPALRDMVEKDDLLTKIDLKDNPPIHKHEDIQRHIEGCSYGCMYLPPYSLELNPIEQL
ncbi:hypothetical protein G6F46_005944 [Rhizopus delemar]|uniref:Tc1-like transposase DDE domain-containing protein n=2 Tax=Rhizopus TaxID=4842 RepID=A0A9P6Z4Y2_9FUNG|nr:hypothetical protein G6F55_003761 [Rhizopus delemar]KAG1544465.1 hypothetical protein G6F51_006043 [Rhizopus arrhizus]KAG1498214.1 hypothetical protein G6F54_005235 [Rhizopus delemar]KAG1511989.1 hypothetical protein G6F53_005524 [Rhizopus delemar]KAG1522911.1 hypothetical protein G6F52_005454 [Rhizopus delemar]